MRILAATPYYEPEGGGLERYAHNVLRRLAARGHDVRVLTFTRTGQPDGPMDGVDVERVRPAFLLGNTPLGLRFARRMGELVEELRPDVLLAHTPVPFAAEAAWRAARRARLPFVVTYHAGRLRGSSPPRELAAAVHRSTFERRMLEGAAALIAVSPYVRRNALAGHEAKTTVLSPGVDARRHVPPARPPPGNSALFVAPLRDSYRWKGLDVALDAQALVQKRLPEATLTVVGDGERRAALERRAQRDGLRVFWRGRVSDEDLIRAYQEAAVVLLPSTSDAESFGMVLAEANACGRPVVGSDIGGIPDFVRDGENGLLVRPGDAHDLAEKVARLLSDPQLRARMGHRGRQRVVQEHDWNQVAAGTEQVLVAAMRAGPA